ncbi:hypothetical protein AGMMS4952_09410 [Spirochaetia bacterium]|nr:hypothetical protein AGMMS4952_09410 [Spirochaetia bacterium]
MITNVFVDTSVLVFPPQSKNLQEEYINIEMFFNNLNNIFLIRRKIWNITIFIRNDIATDLKKYGYMYTLDPNQKQRIANIHKYNPGFEYNQDELLDFYQKLISSSSGKGIIRFNNDRSKDDDVSSDIKLYHENAEVCRNKIVEDEYRKLIAYVKYLNIKYNNADSCYVAICGEKFGYIENNIKIATTKTLYDKKNRLNPKFDSIKCAYKKAKEETAKDLIFGTDIEKSTSTSIVNNYLYNKPPIPNQIYHYLTTLAEVAKKTTINENIDEKTINKVVQIFGCNSSSEDKNNPYEDCRYRKWHDGKTVSQFQLHLKPTTSPPNIPGTTRIYYKYDNEQKKMVVGMILEHPPNCGKCPDEDRCLGMNTIGSIVKRKFQGGIKSTENA